LPFSLFILAHIQEDCFIKVFINKAEDYVNLWEEAHGFATLTEDSRATPVLQTYVIFKLW